MKKIGAVHVLLTILALFVAVTVGVQAYVLYAMYNRMHTAVVDSGLLDDLEAVLYADISELDLLGDAHQSDGKKGAGDSKRPGLAETDINRGPMELLRGLLDSTGSTVDIEDLGDLLDEALKSGSLRAPRSAPRPTPAVPREASKGEWKPGVDVRDEADRYVILVDAPGAVESTLDVTVDGKDVCISGVVASPMAAGRGVYIHQERQKGPFSRTVTLPAVSSTDQIRVFYTNGVVVVVLEKLKQDTPVHS